MADIKAYCLKCKATVEMLDPHEALSKNGRPGIAGKCPTCGANLFRVSRRTAAASSPSSPAAGSASKSPKSAKPGSRSRHPAVAAASKHPATGEAGSTVRARRKSPAVSSLVIVESPAKARTIQRYLGKDYLVRASIGHVRDLLRSRLSVDVEHDFAPTYRVPPDKKEIVKELKEAAASAKQVYLATDPDREGEAIAWHLVAATGLDPDRAQRVVFHEITKEAIDRAFAQPRGIDEHLVDAQQARRILDRLVGYQWSPLLWEKVRGHLSAGRVQSVAVRLLVDRERERQAFVPQEYWTLDALLHKAGDAQTFKARLVRIGDHDASISDQAGADAACADLRDAAYSVLTVKRGTRRRSPGPPFITSTLQQEAGRVLGFQAARTMRIAQQLYEGIDLGGEGSTGLITYMRTDSVHVAESAISEARAYITAQFGPQYLPEKPNLFRTKSKSAQEAHEAIRPTSVHRTPEQLSASLSREQLALYRLIWRRFVASQMQPALYDVTTVDIDALPALSGQRYGLRASGTALRFPGYLAAYGESAEAEAESLLPPLEAGDALELIELLPEQHFTEPPPRYTEASLIKELESNGVGRPSTYASIISTIVSRNYVERDGRALVPTETAFIVNDLLVKYFPEVMDVGFTAQMEDDLDQIAAGKKEWVPVVAAFYGPFSQLLARARQEAEQVGVKDEPAGFDCDKCGAPMVIKYGRFGRFIGCSRYPECKNTKPILNKVGVKCPECGADLVQRRSRKGRTFYGCERYPDCKFATYGVPVPQRCANCGGLMVKQGRDKARCITCGAVASLVEPEPTPGPAKAAVPA